MPETCENWLRLVDGIYSAQQTREIYQVLPHSVDFKAPGELWNRLSNTVLREYSVICNKGPVIIWNDREAESNLYNGHLNTFPNFDTVMNTAMPW